MNYEMKLLFTVLGSIESKLENLTRNQVIDIMVNCVYKELKRDAFTPDKELAKGAAGETIINVSLEEWELIEAVIESTFDRFKEVRRGDAKQNFPNIVNKQIKAVNALAKYRGIDL